LRPCPRLLSSTVLMLRRVEESGRRVVRNSPEVWARSGMFLRRRRDYARR
jgi:hypothetical protein